MSTTITRNLEKDGLFVNKFWTGLYTNRQPLYTPISALGIQLVQREDTLWGGLNMQITPQFTLRRRYGFSKACTSAFGSSEWPLTFFSFEDLDGTVMPLVDTQTDVYSFASGSKTSIYTKGTTSQSNFNAVGDTVYWCDGTNAMKWDGTTVSNMGIVAPITAPSLSFVANGALQPKIGYQYVYVFKNSTTEHPSSASPASANTGPIANKTIVEQHTIPSSGPYTITVTNGSTMVSDGGVLFDTNNQPLTSVPSAPTTGEYIPGVAGTGTYTFASADHGKVVDITYTYTLANSVGVNITVGGDRSTDAQVDDIDIYRTADGGSQYYYLATVANPVSGPWTYTDSTPDSGLNDLIIAPVAGVNAPPPAGISLLVWYAGRLWAASGNTLYYSGGPDTLNGVGEEAWPAGNNYTLPGNITALAATSAGLIIWTKDNAYVTTGTNATNFTVPQLWQANWGVPNQNCVAQDGDNLFIFTTKGQIFSNGASGLQEIGFLIEAQLGAFTPASSYIALHRSGLDEGLFVADGSANIYRYSQVSSSWDTVMQPVGGCGAIASIELADGNWHLMMGRPTGSGYALNRDVTTWADDGSAFAANALIGSVTVSPPRTVAIVNSIIFQGAAVGTYPTVSVMLNEVTDTGTLPAKFTALPNPVADPPQLPASTTLWTKRHDLKSAASPLPQFVQHLQLKITFASEAYGNEIWAFGIS